MKNYGVNNYYTYNSNLAYDERYYEQENNRYDVRVEKTRGLSKARPHLTLVPVVLASAAVIAVIALLFQFVQLSTLDYSIKMVKGEISQIEDEIYNADVQIAETLDVNYIRKIAVGKLGMIEPSDEQLMYISYTNENYTVNY